MDNHWLWKFTTLRLTRWQAFWKLVILGKAINFGLWVNNQNVDPNITIDGMIVKFDDGE